MNKYLTVVKAKITLPHWAMDKTHSAKNVLKNLSLSTRRHVCEEKTAKNLADPGVGGGGSALGARTIHL